MRALARTHARPLSWMAFALICAMFLGAAVFGWLARDVEDSGSGQGWGGPGASIALIVMVFVFPAVGVVITARRPENPIGWLLLGIGGLWSLDWLCSAYSSYGLLLHDGTRGASVAAALDNALWVPAIGLMGTFLVLLFPDGHLPGPRWRWVAWASAFAIAVGTFAILFDPGLMTDSAVQTMQNPLGIDGLAGVLGVMRSAIILLPFCILAAAGSLVVRYRRSRGPERMQMKWLATAGAMVAGLFGLAWLCSSLTASVETPAWVAALEAGALFSFCLLPVSIGFAVLRYRLYEIDVIIRRTLTYAVLILVLAAVYLAGVTLLSAFFQTVTGQSGAVAVTLSTLAVAAAFQPLRSRIQRLVDHRFYRAKYDATRTLGAFSGRLREQIDLDALNHEVLDVVHIALQPRHATIWLRSTQQAPEE